jgi:energy-coupling factor transport system permease protein
VRRLDARAQLAWLVTIVVVALVGGPVGVLVAGVIGILLYLRAGKARVAMKAAVGVLPLSLFLAVLDALVGEPARGVVTGGRVMALVLAGGGFASVADGDDLAAALRWLRVPFDVTFALVTGTRLVPLAVADVGDLADAARLRGIAIDGSPVQRLRAWSRLFVPLLVVTIRRGLRLGESMEARGLVAGGHRTMRIRLRWASGDTVATLAAALLAAAVLYIAR